MKHNHRLLPWLVALLGLAICPIGLRLSGQNQNPTPVNAPAAEEDEEDDEEEDLEADGEVLSEVEEAPEVNEDGEEETDVRYNPIFDIDADDSEIDIPIPSFIKREANHIMLNGADWSALRRAFANSTTQPVTIIHLGDSHIQADINTATTRELLQYDFGNAGRGLITPLKLSGTNEPRDYTFTSTDTWTPVKLMSREWNRPMGFTGTSIHPVMQQSQFTVGTSESDDYNPFSSLLIFHGGKMTVTEVTNAQGQPLHFRAVPSRDYTQVILGSQETRVTVKFDSTGDLTLYGVSLGGNRPGVFYHAIGNNGATYATYNRIGNMGQGIAPLKPDLVIISLGTNECFGRFNARTFENSIDLLVKNIRAANPNAQILLTTPIECQKSVTKTVTKRVRNNATRRRNGRRGRRGRRNNAPAYRTVTQRVKSYAPNAYVQDARDVIVQYGKENHIPVLDLWQVAGGKGSSNTWISNNLFSSDRVHHSYKGYHLLGRLVYDALIDALQNPQ